MLNYHLLTKYAQAVEDGIILPEYPRPQLRRDSFMNLNGVWDFDINKTGEIPESFTQKIRVPYPVESCLSGICKAVGADEALIYSRDFDIKDEFVKDITLLHIDGADNYCRVMINGRLAGEHTGGYLPFTTDISEFVVTGHNNITVTVKDRTDNAYPIGKQRKKRGGIWYTPVSGIWQSVWLESVWREYIKSIRITPDVSGKAVHFKSDSPLVKLTVYENGEPKYESVCGEGGCTIPIDSPHLWSPEDPYLYRVKAEAGRDCIESYFAMRSFSTDGKTFLLNGKPYFINGLLDQGYFSDGIYTPPAYDVYADDIRAAKQLGFNALRKHIKTEPMMFYYYCDTLGMLVLQDMVNTGKYSFFKDSILPFAGIRNFKPYVSIGKKARSNFTSNALATVEYLYNCPCVVYYTIFNEGWGQFDGDGLYTLLKKADPTRVYDATSGWFREKLSDVDSRHIYFKPIKMKKSDKTLIVSEFGGYSCSCKGNVFNTDKSFGYKRFDNISDLEDSFISLYENEILGNIKNGLAGAIYTQLSDVEDETNGILTYDRKICKLNGKRILPLMEKIIADFNRTQNKMKESKQ